MLSTVMGGGRWMAGRGDECEVVVVLSLRQQCTCFALPRALRYQTHRRQLNAAIRSVSGDEMLGKGVACVYSAGRESLVALFAAEKFKSPLYQWPGLSSSTHVLLALSLSLFFSFFLSELLM